MEDRYQMLANIVTAICLICICIKFSAAHFTYVLILWIFFLGISLQYQGIWRSWKSLKWKQFPVFLIGVFIFYGGLFVSSIILWDWRSFSESSNLLWMASSFFLFYILGCWYDIHRGIQWGIFLGSAILSLLGFYKWYWNPDVRLFLFSLHANGLGTMIIILIPLLSYYAYKNRSHRSGIGFIFVIALLLFDLYHTESRGAMMALGIGIAGSALFGLSMYWHTLSAKWRISMAILAIGAFALGAGMVDRVSSQRDAWGAGGGERRLMLEASYHMWDDHKWLGVGLANWEAAYYSDAYHPKEGREQGLGMPHNMPVYFFSTTGIVGGLGYCAFLLISFWTILKKSREEQSKELSLAMMAVFLGFTAQSMVDATIINKIPARIYFALWGYYLARTATSSLRSGQGHSLSS